MTKTLLPTKVASFVRKEHRPLIRNALEHGFDFQKGTKHVKVLYGGKLVTTMPLTPSDYRSMKNNISYIKKKTGIDIRKPPLKKKKDNIMETQVEEHQHVPAKTVKSFSCLSCGEQESFETNGERTRHYRESHDTPSQAFRHWIAHDSAGVTFTPTEVFKGAKKYASTETQEAPSFNPNNASAVIGGLVSRGAVIKEDRGKFKLVNVDAVLPNKEKVVPSLESVVDVEEMEPAKPMLQPLAEAKAELDEEIFLPAAEQVTEDATSIEETFTAFFKALRSNDTQDPQYWEAVADIARSYSSIVEEQF
jgi:hypothetical protein